MEELANDPIIAFYMKMSSSTDAETYVPHFSETMLRLSFKEIFGPLRALCPKELQLYRKLILFNFSEHYPSITNLVAIMNCFDEASIREYLNNYVDILEEWRNFLNLNLSVVIYKEALYEILCEYASRYFHLKGHAISDEVLKTKAAEIQKFLRYDVKLPKQWMRSFNALLKNRMGQTQFKTPPKETNGYLNFLKIFADIKSRINFIVVEAIGNKYKLPELTVKDEVAEPPGKKIKSEILDIEVLKTKQRYKIFVSDGNEGEEEYVESIVQASDIDTDIDASVSVVNEAEVEYVESIIQASGIDTDIEASVSVLKEAAEEYSDDDSGADQAVKLEPNEETEIYQELELIDTESDIEAESVAAENEKDDEEEIDRSSNRIVDHDTAISYLAALQAYAVVNGHFEAIGMLDKVDSIFRKKTDEE